MAESYDHLRARVASTAFFLTEPHVPKGRKRRRNKIAAKAEALGREQLEQLLSLLEGRATMLTIGGVPYSVCRVKEGWSVQALAEGAPEHVVLGDCTACSCEDNRFRGGECKHIAALRRANLCQ